VKISAEEVIDGGLVKLLIREGVAFPLSVIAQAGKSLADTM
jgi:hypothetical protein